MTNCVFATLTKGSECQNGCGRVLQMEFSIHPLATCGPRASTVYVADKLDGEYLWCCRACNWRKFTATDEQPDHRCGQNDCIHLGGDRGTVKVECCTGQEKVLLAHKCAVHGRCLPGFVNHSGAIARWNDRKPESDIYKLCCVCPDRTDR